METGFLYWDPESDRKSFLNITSFGWTLKHKIHCRLARRPNIYLSEWYQVSPQPSFGDMVWRYLAKSGSLICTEPLQKTQVLDWRFQIVKIFTFDFSNIKKAGIMNFRSKGRNTRYWFFRPQSRSFISVWTAEIWQHMTVNHSNTSKKRTVIND